MIPSFRPPPVPSGRVWPEAAYVSQLYKFSGSKERKISCCRERKDFSPTRTNHKNPARTRPNRTEPQQRPSCVRNFRSQLLLSLDPRQGRTGMGRPRKKSSSGCSE
ncbi:hypothetical protein ILYODFUR_036437 [Ilyodon furcidens]|uniref:Uncharacterized protein n=1 Tax=Ilyodon furcidens TaxID=33524 RepID=A0ABV0SV58_9TELE